MKYELDLQDARAEGIEIGRSEGLEEGLEKGLEKGHSEGRYETLLLIIENGVKQGLTLEQTAGEARVNARTDGGADGVNG